MKFYIFLIKFLFIGSLFIVSNNNLHLSEPIELQQFSDLFLGWLQTLLSHGKQITGYVIDSEWLPGPNSSPPLEEIK